MRAYYILLLVFLLSVPFSLSADGNLTVFTFRDVSNNELIDDVAVYITINDITNSFFVPEEGILRILGMHTDSDIVIRADDYSTQGNDYYQIFKAGTLERGVANVYLFPVGSLRGIVKDSLDNVMPYAKLKFDCSYDFDFPKQTDEFGSFFVDYLPIGPCMIYASYDSSTGTAGLEIDKGSLTDAEIMLDKSMIVPKKRSSVVSMLVIVLLLAALGFLIHGFYKSNSKKKNAGEKSVSEKKKQGKTPNKIIETLNEKEKKVVEHLLKNNNTAMQSSIRHATNIPRTSLSRVVDSLQRKKIINVEKHGKSVKLALTDFFLDKD